LNYQLLKVGPSTMVSQLILMNQRGLTKYLKGASYLIMNNEAPFYLDFFSNFK
jgi:hypothetical protein